MRFVVSAIFFFSATALFDTVLGDSVSQGQKSVAWLIAVVATIALCWAFGDR